MIETSPKKLFIAFQEYLVRQSMSPATIKNYMADLNIFTQHLAPQAYNGASLLTYSAADIRAYRDKMNAKGLATSTINRRLQALRKFGQFVIESRLRTHNPALEVACLQTGKSSPPRILSDNEADDLLETVLVKATASKASRDYAIILTLLSSGIRLRELVDLRLEDVELGLDEGYLMIGSSAQDGGRVIPFGAATTAALKAYLRVRPNIPNQDHLFLNREGRHISPRTVQRMVTRYAQAAGLEDISTQTLRTTFAHAMFKGTGDLKVVAKLMGHRSTATTARYFDNLDS
ncbi:MAG: hypothetical protein B6I34_01590 [Anaerolineaceae bacterium 4572_32.1]|nr:MAG: hypothetical protein B6I34_01590 [Anaerolineaceae bacterium 4572_32.1]